MALSNAEKLVNLGLPAELAKALQTMIQESVLGTGAVSNVNVAADAAIATSKLADATPLAALVADQAALDTLAAVDTELLTLAAAVTTPAVYSEVAADISAVLVAAGLMAAA